MFIPEEDGEKNRDCERITREDIPCRLPSGQLRGRVGDLRINRAINDRLRSQHPNRCPQTVCHHHKNALRAAANLRICFPIDKQRAGNVEEIECNAVHDHRKDKHPHAVAGIAGPKQTEAKHPREHGHQHHPFDAETVQAERYQQDKTCFGHLRDRDQDIGVLYAESLFIEGDFGEGCNERIGVAVRDLQRYTEQHGENKEDGHLLFFEEAESTQAERTDERVRVGFTVDRATRKRERVGREQKSQYTGNGELLRSGLKSDQINQNHGADEPDRAEYANRREHFHRIQPGFV